MAPTTNHPKGNGSPPPRVPSFTNGLYNAEDKVVVNELGSDESLDFVEYQTIHIDPDMATRLDHVLDGTAISRITLVTAKQDTERSKGSRSCVWQRTVQIFSHSRQRSVAKVILGRGGRQRITSTKMQVIDGCFRTMRYQTLSVSASTSGEATG